MHDINKTVLVTHAGCMDGAGCALVFKALGGSWDNIKTVSPANTKTIKPKDDDTFYIFADVAPRTDEEIEFWSKRGNVLVIDHHETSKHMKDLDWCIIDDSRCACMLFLIHVQKHIDIEILIPFLHLLGTIDDHDRWQNKFKESDDLAIYMKLMGFDRFVDFCEIHSYDLDSIVGEFGVTIDLIKDSRLGYVKKILQRTKVVNDGGYVIGLVVASDHISYLLNEMLAKRPDIQIAMAVDFSNMVVSLRSNDDNNDCAQYALAKGGGGHRRAAGYKLNNSVVLDVIDGAIG